MDQIVPVDGKRKPCGFATLLSSALCEWFLMFLLFVDAALSYFLTKFAQYCELKTPCLLCSRLEYGFGKKKPGFYWSLLCNSHREEISTLVSCPIHANFADVNEMCGECLAPLVMQNKSNSESCRLMVGKSWVNVDKSVLQNLLVNKKLQIGSPDRRICSCCSKSWKAKTDTERLFKLNHVTNVAAKANLKPPLPRVAGRSRFSRKESLKRLRDKVSEKSTKGGSNNVDTLSRFGRGKKKISSHSDTEVLLSEDEGDGKMRSCEICSEPDYDAHDSINSLQYPIVDNIASEKLTNQDCQTKSLILEPPKLVDLREHKNISSLLPGTLIENGQGDLYWASSYSQSGPSSQPIPLDDSTQLLDIAGASFGVSAETSKSKASHPHVPSFSGLSELVSLSYDPSFNNGTMILTKINACRTSEVGDISVAQLSEADVGTSSDGSHLLEPNNIHPTDALAESVETRELSDKHESSVDEDSASQVLPVSVLLDKTDSNNELLDGLVTSDIEGENLVDKLQRQIKLDQDYINSLCKELEEERNASAIAANEAMAMITRLQEEKAALHMEALQYLRMMEEQAEYDVDELARAHDLLAEREKELQDMEYELDFYREYVDDDRMGMPTPKNSLTAKVSETNDNSTLVNGSFFSLDESKAYISQSLKKLEKKLQQGYVNGKLEDMPNGLSNEKIKTEENGHLHEKSDQHASNHEEIDPANMLEEISEVRERLVALETDYKFLKCTTDLLRDENGRQLVQEIAHQLHEIRKIEFRKR